MFHSLTDNYIVILDACEGIPLISASIDAHNVDTHQVAQFCDLSTGKWHDTPGRPASMNEMGSYTMCSLRWDSFP